MNKPSQSILFAAAFGILFELLTIEIYNCAGIVPSTRIMVISTVYYSLFIGNLLIRLHSEIDSKAFIIVIVSNLVLNPLILYFFCLFFTSLLLTGDFLLFYAPVGNTLLFIFDRFVLLHCEKIVRKTGFA